MHAAIAAIVLILAALPGISVAQEPKMPWDAQPPPANLAQATQQKRQAPAAATPQAPVNPSTVDSNFNRVNQWTVGLAAGLLEGTFIRFGAEIARNLNDGENLRVLPVITPGATENVKDLLYLRGIDVAITHADVFEHFRNVEKIPGLERRIHFVSELYISELHVLVRPEIKKFSDLEGKKVSFHTPGAGPSVTGPILFERLGIKVEPVFINNAIALERMKAGEIAALIHTVGKPNPLFTGHKNQEGFHFLPVPFDKFEDLYVPSTFSSADYPTIVKGEPVQTIGVQAVLAVYNWNRDNDRLRRVTRFVQYYFDRFDNFKKPPYHEKWKSVNLAGTVPGWTRSPLADAALKAKADAAAAEAKTRETDQKKRFESFLAERPGAAAPRTPQEREALFRDFLEWSKGAQKR